jgi:hypothetical protein
MLANNSNWRRIDPNRGMVFVVSRRASLGTVLLLSLSLWSICVHHHHKYITKSMYRGRGCAGINWGPVWNYGGHRSCGTLSLKLFDSYRRSLQDLDCFFFVDATSTVGVLGHSNTLSPITQCGWDRWTNRLIGEMRARGLARYWMKKKDMHQVVWESAA